MFNLFAKIQPEQVFTPRAANVNEAMYIRRPALEEAIQRALRSKFHFILHGESGSGKTWLYKSALAKINVSVFTINMANASRFDDLNAAFEQFVKGIRKERQVSRSTSTTGGFDAGVMNAERATDKQYELSEAEPFERCLQNISNKNGTSVLVFDNFESIMDNEKIIKQVVNVLTLLDDENYSKYGVFIAIVGVPSDIRRLFASISRSTTIANRVKEIPEVDRLTFSQTEELILRGFEEKLKYEIAPDFKSELVNLVAWLTDRIPQQVHELCLSIAYDAQKEHKINLEILNEAKRKWMKDSLLSSYSAIDSMMNSRETRIGRRNQTLYSRGLCEEEDFKYTDIELILRREFPSDTKGVILNISQVLSELAGGNNPIIRRTPRGDEYRFSHPQYRMCLRAMLKKNDLGIIEKVDLNGI